MAGNFVESFDNGIGALNHVWGNANIDTSVRGQVTVSGHGGLMEKPSGDSAGHGYGSYSVVASLKGNTEGSAALLWPGNDQWPGPEYDIVEVINGYAYGTVHHEGSNGGDRYEVVVFDGVDESRVHTYTLDWQPGSITYYVDGQRMGTIDDNVGADYAHGGVNEVMGLMNRSNATSMTVYEVSYTASGGGGGGGGAVSVQTPVAAVSVQADSGIRADAGSSSSGSEPSWLDDWNVAWNANGGVGGSWEADFWNSYVSGDWQV